MNPSDSAILLRRADFIKEERNAFVLAKHFAYILLDLRNGSLYALVQSNKFFGLSGERERAKVQSDTERSIPTCI